METAISEAISMSTSYTYAYLYPLQRTPLKGNLGVSWELPRSSGRQAPGAKPGALLAEVSGGAGARGAEVRKIPSIQESLLSDIDSIFSRHWIQGIDSNLDLNVDIEVDVDIDSYLGCFFEGASKSV